MGYSVEMSGAKQTSESKRIEKLVIAEMLMSNFDRLPDMDKNTFTYASSYIGFNGALAGLVSNSLFRRALNIRKAVFSTALPVAVLPFLTTFTLYNAVVSNPLLQGDLTCPSCAAIRGALVGVVGAGLYPILLSAPVNAGVATLYQTTPVPEKGAMMKFIVDITRPVMRKMRAVLVLQAVFGAYLGSRNFTTYTKLAKITFDPDEEELKD